jgi:hypothetical protein
LTAQLDVKTALLKTLALLAKLTSPWLSALTLRLAMLLFTVKLKLLALLPMLLLMLQSQAAPLVPSTMLPLKYAKFVNQAVVLAMLLHVYLTAHSNALTVLEETTLKPVYLAMLHQRLFSTMVNALISSVGPMVSSSTRPPANAKNAHSCAILAIHQLTA